MRARTTARLTAVVAAGILTASACAGADLEEVGAGSGAARTSDTEPATEVGQPGDVVDVRPLSPTVVPSGARGWGVTYLSEGVRGGLVEVGGVVYAPDGPAPEGGRPVVSWGHSGGSNGLGVADSCAPTQDEVVDVPLVEELIAAGSVVVATDYEGLGQEGAFPYMVATGTARNMLDAARAAQEVPGSGAGRDVVVVGHGSGGQSAAMAAAIGDDYAPDLTMKGAVSVGTPFGLETVMETTARTPEHFPILAFAVKGFDHAYDDLAASDVLTPRGVELLEEAESSCLDEFSETLAGLAPEEFVKTIPSDHPAWRDRIHENEPTDDELVAPILIVHGTADALVTPLLAFVATRELCERGNEVDLHIKRGAGRDDVLEAGKDIVLPWIAARLADEPAVSVC